MIKALFHILKIKPLSSVLAFVFIFAFSKSWGQASLPLSRTTWGGAEPTGWTNSGCNQRTTTFACSGSNGTIFDTDGDSRTVFFSSSPDQLVFKLKKSSMSGESSLLVQESVDGVTWTDDGVYGTATGATAITDCADIAITLNCLSRYVKWTYTKATGNCDMDDVSISSYTASCGALCPEPTVHVTSPIESQIGCNGFNLSWTNGDGTNRLLVVSTSPITSSPVDGNNYAANSSYGSGGTIGANQYVIYNGTGSTDYVLGLAASTTYYYKIFEFNYCSGSPNYLTSGTVASGDVTTTSCSSAAGITAVYIDACAGGCGYEGNNELIWGSTGSYAMTVSNNGPTLHYSSSPTPTVTYISTYATNAANITALNTAVGACGSTTFVDPNTLGYIPPNSNFLIANNCMCSPAAYDFSGLCGSGPIYVVFGTNASWPCNTTGGIFGNYSGGGGVRYFDLNFSAWGVSSAPVYNYTIGSLPNGGDGDATLYNPAGGAATTYTNTTCTVPLLLLPVELIDFYATQNNKTNEVIWKVASEENVNYYILEKSKDGFAFELYTIVDVQTSYDNIKSYSVIDDSPYNDITYYRLSTKESDGSIRRYKIISVDENSGKWDYNYYQHDQNLIVEFKNSVPKNSAISLYDLSGKLLAEEMVKHSQTKIDVADFSSGIYFVKISSPYKTENFKVIIQN